jgi:hypothetical protein
MPLTVPNLSENNAGKSRTNLAISAGSSSSTFDDPHNKTPLLEGKEKLTKDHHLNPGFQIQTASQGGTENYSFGRQNQHI